MTAASETTATSSDGKREPVAGTIAFVQHHLPGLAAGAYQVRVAHDVVATQAEQFSNVYHFAVRGERFAFGPGVVDGTFPPNAAEGEFGNSLPHAVITKQTLPWMRSPTDTPSERFVPGTGSGTDADVLTWLAVLLFDEDDVARYPTFSGKVEAGTVDRLLVKAPNVSTLSPAGTPDAQRLDYGESLADPCRTIDMPLPLFREVAPSLADLKVSAHIRVVNILRKATEGGLPASRTDLAQVPGTSELAVVIGNRVAQTGKRSTAVLVSLESLAAALPPDDDQGGPRAPVDGTAAGFVRLVVLANWTFTSTGTSSHFTNLLSALQPNGEARTDFALHLPVSAPHAGDSAATGAAKRALRLGYTALQHTTRDGGHTISWYRGPLTPYRVATRTLPELAPDAAADAGVLSSADAALCYDPDTGMFDVSYAAAWQLGRLLALQDKHFSVALYNWRRNNVRGVAGRMEQLAVSATVNDIVAQLGDHDVLAKLLRAFVPNLDGNAVAKLSDARAVRVAAHSATLRDAKDVGTQLGELDVPAAIYTWLARLKLLEGIPFTYLVPDERMLPLESIRFFALDLNWVDALLDGALSIGRHAARADTVETAHDAAVASAVRSAAEVHARTIRPSAHGVAPRETSEPLETVSGFLLRSQVVSGWPRLEVNGYAKDGSLLDIVRFERLGDSVLFALFEKAGKSLHFLDIHEPAESLHFGFSDVLPPGVDLRFTTTQATAPAGTVDTGLRAPIPFRADGRTLRLHALAQTLSGSGYATAIDAASIESGALVSSAFALEMVKGVGLVQFNATEETE